MSNQYRSVLASGGAGTGGDAVAANVLAGKTFTNDNGFDTGTMVNNGAVSQTLASGASYTIPEGYHNGNGTVTATEAPIIWVANHAGANSGFYQGNQLIETTGATFTNKRGLTMTYGSGDDWTLIKNESDHAFYLLNSTSSATPVTIAAGASYTTNEKMPVIAI